MKTTDTTTDTPSPILEAQAALARSETALAKHQEKLTAQRAAYHAAESKALDSESDKDFKAAREAAEKLADLERLTAKRQEEIEKAKEDLRRAELADAIQGASLIGKSAHLLDQQLQLDMAGLLTGWSAKLNDYAQQCLAWDNARADVEQRGGPTPRSDFNLQVAPLLAKNFPGHGQAAVIDVAATLAALTRWVQDAPRRASEQKLADERVAREIENERRRDRLLGKDGLDAQEAERTAMRAGLAGFYGESAEAISAEAAQALDAAVPLASIGE